jgi:hypothetical protein
MNRKDLAMTLVLVATAGMACTDGQDGTLGRVHFSQVVDFKETDDFDAPIAAGRTVIVALEHPHGESGRNTELTFEVRTAADQPTDAASWLPLGVAQYAFVISEPGDFRMVALQDEQMLDYLDVVAKPLDHLALATDAEVITRTIECSETSSVKAQELALYRNDSVTLWVVPRSAEGEPMIGLLNLTAEGPDAIALGAPLIGHDQPANALTLSQRGSEDESTSIVVREPAADLGLEVHVRLLDEERDCECD